MSGLELTVVGVPAEGTDAAELPVWDGVGAGVFVAAWEEGTACGTGDGALTGSEDGLPSISAPKLSAPVDVEGVG